MNTYSQGACREEQVKAHLLRAPKTKAWKTRKDIRVSVCGVCPIHQHRRVKSTGFRGKTGAPARGPKQRRKCSQLGVSWVLILIPPWDVNGTLRRVTCRVHFPSLKHSAPKRGGFWGFSPLTPWLLARRCLCVWSGSGSQLARRQYDETCVFYTGAEEGYVRATQETSSRHRLNTRASQNSSHFRIHLTDLQTL